MNGIQGLGGTQQLAQLMMRGGGGMSPPPGMQEALQGASQSIQNEQGQSLLDIRGELQGAVAAALEDGGDDLAGAMRSAIHDTLEANGFDPQEVQRSMRDSIGGALGSAGSGLLQRMQQATGGEAGGADAADPGQLVDLFLQNLRAGSNLDLEF